MAPDDSPPTRSIEFSTSCPACGYDLRGTSVTVCPECGCDDLSPLASRRHSGVASISGAFDPHCHQCGRELEADQTECPACNTPRLAWLQTFDRETYYRASTLLKNEGFLIDVGTPGDSFEGLADIYGFTVPGAGMLWVAAEKLRTVEDLLASRGIGVAMQTGPLVDRTEPICPACSATLDPSDPPVCPKCGLSVTWFDLEAISDEREPELNHEDEHDGSGYGYEALFDLSIVVLLVAVWVLHTASLPVPAIGVGFLVLVLSLIRWPAWLRKLFRSGGENVSDDA